MDEVHDAEHETLEAVEADLAEDFGREGDDPLQQFIYSLRNLDEVDVRVVGQYDGENYELLYLREDLESKFGPEERTARMKAIVMKALGEPVTEPEFDDYGELDAVLRWFENAVVAIYPHDEWSGVFVSFDRTDSPVVDLALEHLA
ncbi:hypothetical protein ACFQJC_16765 [Haloferax namakaokahaiae]|uniref:DUF2004 domain-containing protein n=1 Tax=Haloferax namakaokahaiae TaxID=1748331 RepID=A0ABD5ZIS3_9EURY